MRVYLDNSATTAQLREVTEEMVHIMNQDYGNPSSLHRMGVESEKYVKKARKTAAGAIGAMAEEILFTSGGTESDNTAIFSAVRQLRRQGDHIITTKTEHPAVLECCRALEQEGFRVTYLDVDEDGFLDPGLLQQAIDPGTILVSVMHVNNETGTIQPLEKIGQVVRQSEKALFHTDAVQSFGKLPIPLKTAHIDLLSASGHKIHGPKGTGLLYVRNGLHLPPYLHGGGQERGFRSGTENVPGIAGFAKATEIAYREWETHRQTVRMLRDRLLEGIRTEIQDVRINSPVGRNPYGDPAEGCLEYVCNVSFAGTRGEVLLHMLEQSEIYVSTGSACSSNKKGQSHVLSAMGRSPEEIEGAIRFSLSPYNTAEEMDYTVDRLKKAVESNRKMLQIAGKSRTASRR